VPVPAVVAAPLPRIGDRLEVRKPWWLRLLGVLVRLFVRKPLP
jgi:hypothetical protein